MFTKFVWFGIIVIGLSLIDTPTMMAAPNTGVKHPGSNGPVGQVKFNHNHSHSSGSHGSGNPLSSGNTTTNSNANTNTNTNTNNITIKLTSSNNSHNHNVDPSHKHRHKNNGCGNGNNGNNGNNGCGNGNNGFGNGNNGGGCNGGGFGGGPGGGFGGGPGGGFGGGGYPGASPGYGDSGLGYGSGLGFGNGIFGGIANPIGFGPPEPAANFDENDPNTAWVTLEVPSEQAEVWLNGMKMLHKGLLRKYVTPPLKQGLVYNYEIKVQWPNKAGGKSTYSVTLQFKSGDEIFHKVPHEGVPQGVPMPVPVPNLVQPPAPQAMPEDKRMAQKLEWAKEFLKLGKKDKAKERLQEIVEKSPDSPVGKEAKEL